MDARNEETNITTFEPSSDMIQEEDCNTLLLYLPGFTKDQLRVQLTRTRVLKISGARPLTHNKMSSFQKDFPVPENCDTAKITAKFEDGILYVRQPKASQTPKPAVVELQPKINQPRPPTPQKTSHDDHIKQATAAAATAAAKDAPKKHVESKEKSTSGEGEGGKIKEEKKEAAEEKSDDHRRQKAAAAAEKRDKGAGSSVAAAAKVESDYSKLSPVARLKEMKQNMTNIVVILFVFALGIYVSKLPWFSNRAQDY